MTTDRRRTARALRARASLFVSRLALRLAVGVALIGLLGFGAGCRTVEPWEREQLASPRMQREPHGGHAAFVDHVRQSREAATTGDGSGGGGCGCY